MNNQTGNSSLSETALTANADDGLHPSLSNESLSAIVKKGFCIVGAIEWKLNRLKRT